MGQLEAMLAARKFEDVHECAVDALVVWPDDHRLLLAFARAELHLGSLDRALWAADRAGSLAPQLAEIHFVRSEIFEAMGRYSDQAKAVRTGVELAPDEGRGWLMLAKATQQLAARRARMHSMVRTAIIVVLTAAAASLVAVTRNIPSSLAVLAVGGASLVTMQWLHHRHIRPVSVPTATPSMMSAAPPSVAPVAAASTASSPSMQPDTSANAAPVRQQRRPVPVGAR